MLKEETKNSLSLIWTIVLKSYVTKAKANCGSLIKYLSYHFTSSTNQQLDVLEWDGWEHLYLRACRLWLRPNMLTPAGNLKTHFSPMFQCVCIKPLIMTATLPETLQSVRWSQGKDFISQQFWSGETHASSEFEDSGLVLDVFESGLFKSLILCKSKLTLFFFLNRWHFQQLGPIPMETKIVSSKSNKGKRHAFLFTYARKEMPCTLNQTKVFILSQWRPWHIEFTLLTFGCRDSLKPGTFKTEMLSLKDGSKLKVQHLKEAVGELNCCGNEEWDGGRDDPRGSLGLKVLLKSDLFMEKTATTSS